MGQDEEPFPSVWGTKVSRAHNAPFRIEPEPGKVSEHSLEAQGKVPADILQEDEAGSYLAKDPSNVRPKVPLVGLASPLARDGEGLAGVAGRDEIHSAAPRSAIEGREIVPDRSRIQGLVFHPGHEDARREGVPLDETNGPRSAGQLGSEVEASDPGAEREGT